VARYVEPLVRAGARVLVLGCTHYPLLAPVIARVAGELAGEEVVVVDSAVATAEDLSRFFVEERIARAQAPASRAPFEILVTDRPASFREISSRFLGFEVAEVTQIDLRES
jgi:glutamate racemase